VHINDNTSHQGSGAYIWNSDVTFTNCVFDGNEAQDGAGIYDVENLNLVVQDCVFTGNYATRHGAAIYFDESFNSLIEDCDVQGNNSAWGSIVQIMYYSTPTLRRLSVIDNNHGDGIGAGCCGTAGIVEDCLVAFNRGGVGIYENPAGGSSLTISCTNVYGNEEGEYSDDDHTGTNGNISLDPLLCDSTYDTLGLAIQSPCLPLNNDCGALMGNHGAECTLTEVEANPSTSLALAAHPNPFNPSCKLSFTLPRTGHVSLKVFDVSGREVATLIDAVHPGGLREFDWNADGLPSGVYLARLEAGEFSATERVILLK